MISSSTQLEEGFYSYDSQRARQLKQAVEGKKSDNHDKDAKPLLVYARRHEIFMQVVPVSDLTQVEEVYLPIAMATLTPATEKEVRAELANVRENARRFQTLCERVYNPASMPANPADASTMMFG